MLVRIDAASERPIYAQIADSIRGSIAAQRVLAGQLLPPAREIAEGLGINAHTVLHAYQALRDEGLVDLRRGRGAVVTEAAPKLVALHVDVAVLVARARALGVAPSTLAAMITDPAHLSGEVVSETDRSLR
ncbi:MULTISPECIES: GntR family transcriptional regulator [Bacteria]|uniref:GntR family transcriptional regulator n=1 Tax=Bacteria TaxID=2 RepID=UPI000621D198|nr:GntR family transcriptional regulator [Leucobacter sp. Ag1]KKI16971.1 GntR family transcriptional regulator [Leucobacter sp. Ag1]